MNLENIVCSAEISIKLKEIGVDDKSIFSWFDTKKYGKIVELSNSSFDLDHYLSVQRLGSAYTVSELASYLPPQCRYSKSTDKETGLIEMGYKIEFLETENGGFLYYDENLTNCLGKMLIYLIEKEFIK